jgi:UDP-N-acetyl-D-glucosamine/UDP-N-acetyl-D-galactosamine dehydrogenase
MTNEIERIAVIGLGYVGLPVAVALARCHRDVIGFDISAARIAQLQANHDSTGEVSSETLSASQLRYSTDPTSLVGRSFYIVTVPTPIDAEHAPDLGPLRSACELLGPALTAGAVVVFESTVYPGVTEDVCGPLLEHHSGLTRGRDFFLAYSPERINPGDREHRLETITKVIAAENVTVLERLRVIYGSIVSAGLHEAPSIRVAEAAKVLENTQRDLNIALMNELAIIMDRMKINTADVLNAAGTKWNFLPFRPGLVGGHCIGVDPYYLTYASEKLGYRPEVILSGRSINDRMGSFIADKAVELMLERKVELSSARVAVLGLTFKENVPDIRNSRVPDVIISLERHGIRPLVHDPLADEIDAHHEYGVALRPLSEIDDLDCVILAVGHRSYIEGLDGVIAKVKHGGLLVDVKSCVPKGAMRQDLHYWAL